MRARERQRGDHRAERRQAGQLGPRAADGELDGVVDAVGVATTAMPASPARAPRRVAIERAPAAPSANQQAPCSPRREYAATARSRRGVWPRVRSNRRAARSRPAMRSAGVRCCRSRPGAPRDRRARRRPCPGRARRCRPRPSGRASRLRRARCAAGQLGRGDPRGQDLAADEADVDLLGLLVVVPSSVTLRGLDDLGEDAAGGGGMDEGDAGAADPGARLLVDQARAGGRERCSVCSTSSTR